MTRGANDIESLPDWNDMKICTPSAVKDSPSIKPTSRVKIPPELEKNMEEYHSKVAALRTVKAGLALELEVETADSHIARLHKATLQIEGLAESHYASQKELLRAMSVHSAVHENISRQLVAIQDQQGTGRGMEESDPPLSLQRALLSLQCRILRLKEAAEGFEGRARLSQQLKRLGSAQGMDLFLEGMEREMETIATRFHSLLIDSASLGKESETSFSVSPMKKTLSLDDWLSFHDTPLLPFSQSRAPLPLSSLPSALSLPFASPSSAASQRDWKEAAKGLRRRMRPRLSLSVFEEEYERGRKGGTQGERERESLLVDPFSPFLPDLLAPLAIDFSCGERAESVFKEVWGKIEHYNGVKLVQPPPPAPLPSPPIPAKNPTPIPAPATAPEPEEKGDRGERVTLRRKNSLVDETEEDKGEGQGDKRGGRERSNSKHFFSAETKSDFSPPPAFSLSSAPPTPFPASSAAPQSSSSPPAPASSATSSSFAQRVEEIYRQYNPAKLSEVHSLLKKYAGREGELVEKLEKKYVTSHSAPKPPAAAAASFQSPPMWGNAVSSPSPFSQPPRTQPMPPTSTPSLLLPTSRSAIQPSPSLFGGHSPSPFTSAPLTPGFSSPSSTQPLSVQQRVREIYERYNPSKLGEIPQILEKYRGKEAQLIANLEKKYNCAGGQTSSGQGGQGQGLFQGQGQSLASPFGAAPRSLFSSPQAQPSPAFGGQSMGGMPSLFGGGGALQTNWGEGWGK